MSETLLDSQQTPLPDLSGRTVVVAEDDLNSYLLLEYIIRKTGSDIFHVKTGLQLMRFLDKTTPDLIMLDINMPEMDGIECLEEMKKREIPSKVIIQTAYSFGDERERVMNAGAAYFIQKPVRRKELLRVIQFVLAA